MGDVIDLAQRVAGGDPNIEKAMKLIGDRATARSRKQGGRMRKSGSSTDAESFAEAMARLAPLLREYDREELFGVLFRLQIRDLRERMYGLSSSSKSGFADPDNFHGGINAARRAEIEERTRALVASLG